MLPSEIPKLPPDPPVKWFPIVETSPSQHPPQDGSPSLTFVSLSFFSFIFCPISFWREWAAFLGAWCPLPALFCGSCSTFKWTFDEFVGEKVVPCPIPPPSWDHPAGLGIFHGPTDLCVCCKIQQENRTLKTLKFKLPCYRICNVNLIILKIFSSLIRIIWCC